MGGTIATLLEKGDRQSPHVDRAIEEAATQDARLHAVYVINAWRFGEYSVYGWEELAREIHTENGGEILDEIRERCAERGVPFQSTITEGEPLEVVNSLLDAQDVDSLICKEPDGSGRRVHSPKTIEHIDTESSTNVEVV